MWNTNILGSHINTLVGRYQKVDIEARQREIDDDIVCVDKHVECSGRCIDCTPGGTAVHVLLILDLFTTCSFTNEIPSIMLLAIMIDKLSILSYSLTMIWSLEHNDVGTK